MPGFELMNAHKFEIDTSDGGTTPTWAVVAKGFNNAEPQTNEEIDQTKYFDGSGFGESDVIGAQLVLALSGHRYYGDEAQDYIFGKLLELGPKRRTKFRWTQPDGTVYEGPCTIANIEPGSGEAGAKAEVSCEIHFNGKPTKTTTPPTTEGTTV